MSLKLKKYFLCSLCILLSSCFESRVCDLSDSPVVRKVKVNDYPSFFFKIHPSGRYIGYIDIHSNKLLDLETGKTFPLPGTVDPVFSPDGRIMTMPMFDYEFNGPLNFEERIKSKGFKKVRHSNISFFDPNLFIRSLKRGIEPKKYILKKQHSEPLHRDRFSYGTYQSIGMLSKGHYIVITDERGAMTRKYKFNKNGKLTFDGKFQPPCQNIKNFPSDLPIISKDAKYLSVFNKELESTQIYNLKRNGSCSLAINLGLATGKVSFNRDSTQIAFHMDHFGKKFGKYFNSVGSDIIKDSYVAKLRTSVDEKGETVLSMSSIAKISMNSRKGDGSYYPDFDNDGNIYYMQDSNNQFEFVKIDATKLNFFPVEIPTDESKMSSLETKNYILGKMWGQKCQGANNISLTDGTLLKLSLDKDNCEDMVSKFWNTKFKNNIKNSQVDSISKEDLLKACPSSKIKSNFKVVGKWNKPESLSLKRLVKQKCLSCHSSDVHFKKEEAFRLYTDENNKVVQTDTRFVKSVVKRFDPQNIDYKLANRMMNAITDQDSSKRMPPGLTLRNDEIQLFYNHLREEKLKLTNSEQFIQPRELLISGYKYSAKALDQKLKEYQNGLDPSLSLSAKKKLISKQRKQIDCEYGKIKCGQYIESQVSLLGSEKLKVNKRLELMCKYAHNVSREDCVKK